MVVILLLCCIFLMARASAKAMSASISAFCISFFSSIVSSVADASDAMDEVDAPLKLFLLLFFGPLSRRQKRDVEET